MQLIPHQNAASATIAVTDTATALFSLIDTAGTVTNSQAYFTNVSTNGRAIGSGLMITPEDGDIRIGYGVTPTAALGNLVSAGQTLTLHNIKLSSVKLIRTGGANVACSINIFA